MRRGPGGLAPAICWRRHRWRSRWIHPCAASSQALAVEDSGSVQQQPSKLAAAISSSIISPQEGHVTFPKTSESDGPLATTHASTLSSPVNKTLIWEPGRGRRHPLMMRPACCSPSSRFSVPAAAHQSISPDTREAKEMEALSWLGGQMTRIISTNPASPVTWRSSRLTSRYQR